MPEYRRARIEGATYFFTVVTHRRRPVLCLPESLDAMKDVVRKVAETRPFQIDAWVVLPDHLHCVWTMPRVGVKHVSPLHREMGLGEEGVDEEARFVHRCRHCSQPFQATPSLGNAMAAPVLGAPDKG
jgi:hypothetical protein